MDNETVFLICANRYSPGKNESVYIKDIAEVYCYNDLIKKEVEGVKVYKTKDNENWDYLTINAILKKILEKYPNLNVNAMGATDVIIEIKSKEKPNKVIEFIKTALVCIVLFFGAAMGIIYFHEDVNMSETLNKIYFTFIGVKKENPLIMTIPYSFGLGIGMITFFKRIVGTKSIRRKKEPGPLDLETYQYKNVMNEYILNEMKKGQEKD